MEITWEEVLIQASDRAAIVVDMTLVLPATPETDANEFPPQFTFGYKSCLE